MARREGGGVCVCVGGEEMEYGDQEMAAFGGGISPVPVKHLDQ